MLCIHIQTYDPFFCLAAEELLLKSYREDIFLVWQSDNAVIVGKHQNALAEIDYRFVRENHIVIARRISGGGTVYQDRGNVNFAYIRTISNPGEINFRDFLGLIAAFFEKLGITAFISGKNNLTVAGRKVSGNAGHVYKNRVLHHGTLLFDSDLEKLSKALRVDQGRYSGKAVQSVPGSVININPFLKTDMDTDSFIQALLQHHLKPDSDNKIHVLSEKETETISRLAEDKFATPEWCFGYSPGYIFRNELVSGGRVMKVELHVTRGIIVSSLCSGNLGGPLVLDELNRKLAGRKHLFEDVQGVLRSVFPLWNDDEVYSFF